MAETGPALGVVSDPRNVGETVIDLNTLDSKYDRIKVPKSGWAYYIAILAGKELRNKPNPNIFKDFPKWIKKGHALALCIQEKLLKEIATHQPSIETHINKSGADPISPGSAKTTDDYIRLLATPLDPIDMTKGPSVYPIVPITTPIGSRIENIGIQIESLEGNLASSGRPDEVLLFYQSDDEYEILIKKPIQAEPSQATAKDDIKPDSSNNQPDVSPKSDDPEDTTDDVIKVNMNKNSPELKAARDLFATGQLPAEVIIVGERVRLNETGFLEDKFNDLVSFKRCYFPNVMAEDIENAKALFSMLFSRTVADWYPPCDEYQRYLLQSGLMSRRNTLYIEMQTVRRQRGDAAMLRRKLEQYDRLRGILEELKYHFKNARCEVYKADGSPLDLRTMDLTSDDQIKDLLRKFAFVVLQSRNPLNQYSQTTEDAKVMVNYLNNVIMTQSEMEKYLQMWTEQAKLLKNPHDVPKTIVDILSITGDQPSLLDTRVESELETLLATIMDIIRIEYEEHPEIYQVVNKINTQEVGVKQKIIEIIKWIIQNNLDAWDELSELQALHDKLKAGCDKTNAQLSAQMGSVNFANQSAKAAKQEVLDAKTEGANKTAEVLQEKNRADSQIKDLINQLEELKRKGDTQGHSDTCLKGIVAVGGLLVRAREFALSAISINDQLNAVIAQNSLVPPSNSNIGPEGQTLVSQINEVLPFVGDPRVLTPVAPAAATPAAGTPAATPAAGTPAATPAAPSPSRCSIEYPEVYSELSKNAEYDNLTLTSDFAALKIDYKNYLLFNKNIYSIITSCDPVNAITNKSDPNISVVKRRLENVSNIIQQLRNNTTIPGPSATQKGGGLQEDLLVTQEELRLQTEENQRRTADLGKAQADFVKLQADFKKSNDTLTELQNTNATLQANNDKATANIQNLTASIESLKVQNESLQEQIQITTDKIKVLEEENKNLEKDDNADRNNIKELSKNINDLKGNLVTLQNDKKRVETELQIAKKANTKLESENKHIKNRVNILDKDLTTATKGIDNMIKNLEKMSDTILNNTDFTIMDDLPCGVSTSFMEIYNKLKGRTGPFKNPTCYLIYFIKFFNKILFDGRSKLLRTVQLKAQSIGGDPYTAMDTIFTLLQQSSSSSEGLYELVKSPAFKTLQTIVDIDDKLIIDLEKMLKQININLPPITFKIAGQKVLFLNDKNSINSSSPDTTTMYTSYGRIVDGKTTIVNESIERVDGSIRYSSMLCLFIVLGNMFLDNIPNEIKKCGLNGIFILGPDVSTAVTHAHRAPQPYNPPQQYNPPQPYNPPQAHRQAHRHAHRQAHRPPQTVPQTHQPPQTVPQTHQPPQTVPQTHQPPQTVPQAHQPPQTVPQAHQPPQTVPHVHRPPQAHQPPQTVPHVHRPPQTVPHVHRPPQTVPHVHRAQHSSTQQTHAAERDRESRASLAASAATAQSAISAKQASAANAEAAMASAAIASNRARYDALALSVSSARARVVKEAAAAAAARIQLRETALIASAAKAQSAIDDLIASAATAQVEQSIARSAAQAQIDAESKASEDARVRAAAARALSLQNELLDSAARAQNLIDSKIAEEASIKDREDARMESAARAQMDIDIRRESAARAAAARAAAAKATEESRAAAQAKIASAAKAQGLLNALKASAAAAQAAKNASKPPVDKLPILESGTVTIVELIKQIKGGATIPSGLIKSDLRRFSKKISDVISVAVAADVRDRTGTSQELKAWQDLLKNQPITNFIKQYAVNQNAWRGATEVVAPYTERPTGRAALTQAEIKAHFQKIFPSIWRSFLAMNASSNSSPPKKSQDYLRRFLYDMFYAYANQYDITGVTTIGEKADAAYNIYNTYIGPIKLPKSSNKSITTTYTLDISTMLKITKTDFTQYILTNTYVKPSNYPSLN